MTDHLIYVPGVWRCAKCQFRLVQSNLNAQTGTVSANDKAGEKCPNCDTVLWRVTWKEEATEAYEMLERNEFRHDDLGSGVYRVGENIYVWYDEGGQLGGCSQTEKCALAQLANYAKNL